MATDPEVPGSIPGASRFSEEQRVWNGVHSASWGQLRSYLEEIVAAPVKKTEINDRGGGNPLRWPRNALYPRKLTLLRQQASVGRHSSLADQSHGVFKLHGVTSQMALILIYLGKYLLCNSVISWEMNSHRHVVLITKERGNGILQ
jgi:hypothetical protein